MKELIESYIETLNSHGDKDEVYKWEAINHFQANWNLDDENFTEMFLNAFGKVGNLLYLNSWGFISTAVTHFPDEVKKMFEELYNEVTPLEERMKSFQKSAKILLPQVKSAIGKDKLNTQQDERTLSVYLSFRYPEKYYLYKSSFYSKLCAIMGIDTKPPGQRLIHYMDIAEKVKQEYIINNQGLQRLSKDIYPETSWDDTNLFTQNFFYNMLEKGKPDQKEQLDLAGESELINIIQSHNKKDLLDYFQFLDTIIEKFKIEQDDVRVVTNTPAKQLNFTVGQRYCWILYPQKRENGKFCMITSKKINEQSFPFDGKEKFPFHNDFDDYNFALAHRDRAYEAIERELERTKKSGYYKHNNETYRRMIFDKEYRNHILNTAEYNLYTTSGMEERNPQFPLNQILYGPPGTGKTYELKKENFPRYTLKETSITKETFFEETVRELTWWQVIALALIEGGTSRVNDLLKNKWVAAKANMSESKNVRATLWGNLQMHTIHESTTVAYTQRQVPLIFDKNEDKSWSLMESELQEQSPELYDILESVNNFEVNPQKEIKHYVFTTFHQSFSYEDFVEGIKPKLNTEAENNELSYQIENGVFKDLCLRAQNDPNNRYAIFIDEINRGNVSAIFGELITLIEPDKRLGADNEIKVRLPYSKTDFGVPNNVDIYGTMNTADRSVEALDTALRRRFSFKEIMPHPSLLENIEFNGFNLKEVLQTINERVEFLLDRDHTIGHSYFMNVKSGDTKALEDVFKNKVIPLLQEYFYHDYEKIALILGAGFLNVKTNHAIKFPTFDGITEPDNVTLCTLIENIEDIEKAVTLLLNQNAS